MSAISSSLGSSLSPLADKIRSVRAGRVAGATAVSPVSDFDEATVRRAAQAAGVDAGVFVDLAVLATDAAARLAKDGRSQSIDELSRSISGAVDTLAKRTGVDAEALKAQLPAVAQALGLANAQDRSLNSLLSVRLKPIVPTPTSIGGRSREQITGAALSGVTTGDLGALLPGGVGGLDVLG